MKKVLAKLISFLYTIKVHTIRSADWGIAKR